MKKPSDQNKPVNEVPDYYCGHLIYQDATAGNNNRWVVYNGTEKHYFFSKSHAQRFAAERAAQYLGLDEATTGLQHKFYKLAKETDEVADKLGIVEKKLRLQAYALQIRRMGDRLAI